MPADPDPAALLRPGDGLLLVDVQRDFCAGGPLGAADTDAMVHVLNTWIEAAVVAGVPVHACRDWHPVGHVSFERYGVHCVQRTEGAEFHPALALPRSAVVVEKGYEPDHDSLSGFGRTTLAAQLRGSGASRLWVGGLSFSGCVAASVRDALAAGFAVAMIPRGSATGDPAAGDAVLAELDAAGVELPAPGPMVSRAGAARGPAWSADGRTRLVAAPA